MIRREIWILLAVVTVLFACSEKKGPVEPAGCTCEHQGDLNSDDMFDLNDILRAISIVFHDSADVKDRDCPHVGRADVNCDCVVDSFDVYYIIGYAFRNEQLPCNPCDSGMGCPRPQPGAGSPSPDSTDCKGLKPLVREVRGVRFPLPPRGVALTSGVMIESAEGGSMRFKGLKAPCLKGLTMGSGGISR